MNSAEKPRTDEPSLARAMAARTVHGVGRALCVLAEFLILLLTLLFTYEVVMRYVFTRPSAMADQLGALLMPAIAFLALARTYRDGAHVNVDVLVNRLRPPMRRRVHSLTEFVTLVLTGMLTWYSLRTVIGSYEEEERLMLGITTIPLYIPQIVMPLGLGLLTLQIALSLWLGQPAAAGETQEETV